MNESGYTETLVEFVKSLKDSNVPEKDYLQRIETFLEEKARRQHIPRIGHFELTPLCNLDCKMCYVHLTRSQFSPEQLLTPEQWISIMDQAYKLGMRMAALTGGECLTYPGFEKVYLHLLSLRVRTAILSNGLLIDEKRIDFFRRHRPEVIVVTLYGGSDDCYEAVTGHRVFDKVYHNLQLLKNQGIHVKISVTPNQYMLEGTNELIEKLEELGIPYGINKMLIPPRDNTGRTVEDLSAGQYVEVHRIRSVLRNRVPISLDSIELPEIRSQEPCQGLQCGAGRSGFSIKYDGSICACFGLNIPPIFPLQIGFGQAWKQINDYAESYPYPQECNGCVYHDQCRPCPIMHQNAPRIGHCDPTVCEKTKEYIRAGLLSIPSESIKKD